MNKYMYVAPIKVGDTQVSWNDGCEHQFDSKIAFTQGIVFFGERLVLVFHSLGNDKTEYVGRAFDFKGNPLFDIPFPVVAYETSNTVISYGWSSYVPGGIKIVFGTNVVNHQDFWCDFDLVRRTYTASGRAY